MDLDNLEFSVPRILYTNVEQVREAIFDKYLRPDDNRHRALVKIISDQNFVVAAVEEAHYYSQAGAAVYTYVFDYTNQHLTNKTDAYDMHDGKVY